MNVRARLFAGFAEAEPSWRALEAAAPTHPFQTFEWQSAWYDCIGVTLGVKPLLVLVEGPAGEPWMLLPLGLFRAPLARVLSWLGGDLTDYLGPLVSPDCPDAVLADFPAVWRAVVALLPSFTYASLVRQPARISGRDNPFLSLGVTENPSRSHQATLTDDWDDWYAMKCSTRARSKDRQRDRKLEARGGVELHIARASSEIEALLPTLFEQKSAGYRDLGVPDLFADPAYRDFLRRVTLRAPYAHLSALRVGGQPWATHWGLCHQGRFYCLLPAYDRGEPAALSPGAALFQRLLRWAVENDVHTFDFTVGDEPYKKHWCEIETPLYDSVLPRGVWGWAYTRGVEAATEAKRRIKASPKWYPLALEWRARLFGG